MPIQGWGSGEHLPPTWFALKSWHWHRTWVEFVVGSLPCSGRFFSGHSGFPLSLKTIHSKFQFDQDRCRTSHCGCATPCSGRFFSGHSGFPLSLKTIHSKFQFDQDRCRTSHCGCATSQSLYFIYFICLIPLFQGHNYVLTCTLPFRINVP